MYKLIATDMDGTLLNSKNKVSKENIESIIKAQQNGTTFSLASGRPTEAMVEYAKELEMDKYEGYIISYNGAQITDCKTKELLYSNPLTKEQIEYVYEMSLKYDVTLITYVNGMIYSSRLDEYADIEATYTKMQIHKFKDTKELEENDIIKFMFVFDPERIKEIYNDFKDECKKMDLVIAISDPHFLEIIDKKSNKGVALKKVCDILNIDKSEVIACGDSFNDVPMLEVAGLSVAAKNAKKEIKDICTYVSVDNNEHILKDVIEKFVL